MVTQAEAAAAIFLSVRQFRTLVKDGVLPAKTGKGWNIEACRAAYGAYRRTLVRKQETAGTAATNRQLKQQQIRRLRLQSDIAELEARQRAGHLHDRDQCHRETFRRARSMRDAVLAVPDRVGASLTATTDPQKIRSIIAAELSKALAPFSIGQ